jgi:hypothetical protein
MFLLNVWARLPAGMAMDISQAALQSHKSFGFPKKSR